MVRLNHNHGVPSRRVFAQATLVRVIAANLDECSSVIILYLNIQAYRRRTLPSPVQKVRRLIRELSPGFEKRFRENELN
jgi:hypothetical protein